jgi:hypothetical protein
MNTDKKWTFVMMVILTFIVYRWWMRGDVVERFTDITSGSVVTIQNVKTGHFLSSCEHCPGGAVEFGQNVGPESRWIVTVTLDGFHVFINDKNRQILAFSDDGKLTFSPVHVTAVGPNTKFTLSSDDNLASAVIVSPFASPNVALSIRTTAGSGEEPYEFLPKMATLSEHAKWNIVTVAR